jgi:site-specific DNA recombinase
VIDRLREAVTEGNLVQEVTAAVKEQVAARRKDLVMERKGLPGEIATLSSERKRLVETMADLTENARPPVEKGIHEAGEQLAGLEARLTEVEGESASLDSAEAEAGWLAQALEGFSSVWDILTPENRGRLLRAVVQRVEVDEPANRVRVVMTDLEDGLQGVLSSRESEQGAMA